MSAQHTPGRNPWKTTRVNIAPSVVYVMALLRDKEFPFEPHTHAQGRAIAKAARSKT